MKKKLLSIVLSVALSLSLCCISFAATDDGIVILATNDIHCAYESYSKLVTLAKDADLLVDSGDYVSGATVGTLSKGSYIIELLNTIGYDAVTVGNHEFDFPEEYFKKNLLEDAEFPIVCCNVKYVKTGKNVFDPYVICDVDGTKVAFVGVLSPETLTKSDPKNQQDANGDLIYSFSEGNNGKDLFNAVQTAVDGAKADGADYVFLLSHLGNEDSSAPWRCSDVAANTTGIDGVLDGHSHKIFNITVNNKEGKAVPMVQAGTEFAGVSKIVISKDGTVTTDIITLDGVEADAESEKNVAAIKAKVEEKTKTVIAKSEIDLSIYDKDGNRLVRNSETAIANLAADAMKAVSGADIGVVNGGGVRKSINLGDITYGNIIDVFPFNNSLCIVEVDGQTIADMLEMSYRTTPKEYGGMLHTSGLTYTVDMSVESTVEVDDTNNFVKVAGARRVSDIKVNGKALNLTNKYTLAGTNFTLISCGDGHAEFTNAKTVKDEIMLDNQAFIQYITENLGGVIKASDVKVGRVTVIPIKEASEVTEKADTTYTVTLGDCLWRIAQKILGDKKLWKNIYEANKTLISNPDRIYPGQVLTIPAN